MEKIQLEDKTVQYYLAPMQEVTGYVFRNVYQELFGDMDKYFTPFIAPTKKKILKTRERKDVAPEHNKGMYVVPQILTNDAEQFVDTCHMLMDMGYHEVNLNLGCPAATVVSKRRGSGFLEDPKQLDLFFDEVFHRLDKSVVSDSERGIREEMEDSSKVGIQISVKTRLGLEFSEEFEDILKVYNSYPLHEVIIHPRLQKDFYGNQPDWETFGKALENSRHPVCYNGDIFTREDYEKLMARFPTVNRIMFGRGLVANPGLVREILTGKVVAAEELRKYHDRLFTGYMEAMGSEKDTLFKMKEVWGYLGMRFVGEEAEKCMKKIRKAKNAVEYRLAVERMFATVL